ncbi:MAG TPA: sigma 54-interacting transcriptional regulator [Kofleriaceae bacterium]|nr:sigma 54-interacting transcriptional regulator [Kofleriaceae bacterium]
MTQRVLLLGPDDDARRALHLMLDRAGKQVAATTEVAGASRYLGSNDCDAVIADGALAAALLGATNGSTPPVIAVVRPRDVALSMSLLDAGVDDVVSDPVDELALTLALRHVAARPRKPVAPVQTTALIGDGQAMQALRQTIERIAGHRATVLILGESGTGKELVARAIHEASPRRGRKFVAINCAAIPAALLESELFGHTRGAFTDATRDKVGLFEDADGGSIFLDEIGELPLPLQAKLLRVLQEGEIRRVGDHASQKVDVRVIAATLRDLAVDVGEGRFREDLYYRLNVVPVAIPPLRDRAEDIPQLARFFAERHAAKHGRVHLALTATAIDALLAQPWPGNVRELENVVERALILADGPAIDVGFLGTVMNVRPVAAGTDTDALSIKKATRELEADLIKRALEATQGNRTNAAKLLEISHRALLYKMKDYGIS